jgi:hypothetical protein
MERFRTERGNRQWMGVLAGDRSKLLVTTKELSILINHLVLVFQYCLLNFRGMHATASRPRPRRRLNIMNLCKSPNRLL